MITYRVLIFKRLNRFTIMHTLSLTSITSHCPHPSLQGRDVDCVSLLLAFSADVNAFDRRDLTALDIADRTHNDHLVQLILGVGGKRFETIQKVTVLTSLQMDLITVQTPCAL